MTTIDASAEELQHHRRLLADDVRRRSARLRRPRRLAQSTLSETRDTQAKQQRLSAEETKRPRPRARTAQPRQQTQAERTMQLRSMRERVEQARARQALRDVQDSSWWNRASASDLERVRAIANRAGSTERQAIHGQMQNVARTRHGTTVSGAIQYERSNPNQPPPDLAHARGPVR